MSVCVTIDEGIAERYERLAARLGVDAAALYARALEAYLVENDLEIDAREVGGSSIDAARAAAEISREDARDECGDDDERNQRVLEDVERDIAVEDVLVDLFQRAMM